MRLFGSIILALGALAFLILSQGQGVRNAGPAIGLWLCVVSALAMIASLVWLLHPVLGS